MAADSITLAEGSPTFVSLSGTSISVNPTSADQEGTYQIVVDFKSSENEAIFNQVTDLDNSCYDLVRRVHGLSLPKKEDCVAAAAR